MSDRFEYLPIDSIRIIVNVRQRFDEDKLKELASSIAEHGIIEPLIVRQDIELPEGTYALVAGERRLRAARLASLETVPAIVRALTAMQASKIQLLENLQRQDLDPIEEAAGLKRLLGEHGYTQDKLAEELGISQSHIANRIRLLRLPEKAQDAISRGILFAGHGLALLKLAPEGVSPSPLLKEAVKQMLDNPPAVAAAGDAVDSLIRSQGKGLRKAEYDYQIGYYAAFDYKKECAAIKCPYLVKSKDNWEGHSCINPSCWEKKQAAGKATWERETAERKAKERKRQQAEQRKFAAAEKQRTAQAKRQRMEEVLGDIPAPATAAAAVTEPEQLPLGVRFMAEEQQSIGKAVWQAHGKGQSSNYAPWGWNAPTTYARECLLPLPDLLQFFIARQEIGASHMPLQFGDGELHAPGLWIRGTDGEKELAGISFDGDTMRLGRSAAMGGSYGGYVTEPRPESPVYYRIEIGEEKGSRILRQQIVIEGENRFLALTGRSHLGIRKELLPKLQALIEALPAMPGEVKLKSAAATAPQAAADEDLSDFEAGPFYPRHYCTKCRKQVSDLETLAKDGRLLHVPVKGDCDGNVILLEPGEREPEAADQQTAS